MKRKGVRVKSLSPNCTVRVFSARDCTMQYSTTLNELHRTSKKCATSKLRRLCSTYKVIAKKKKRTGTRHFSAQEQAAASIALRRKNFLFCCRAAQQSACVLHSIAVH